MSYILNYYVEVKNDEDLTKLETLLVYNNFPFYDATVFDPYTGKDSNYSTLESIEADLECK